MESKKLGIVYGIQPDQDNHRNEEVAYCKTITSGEDVLPAAKRMQTSAQ